MKLQHIKTVKEEAKRLLSRIKEYETKEFTNWERQTAAQYKTTRGCLETGAIKRASMDLTRSLSKLRNDTY